MPEKVEKQPRGSAAAVIAAGIFVSRVIGFLRERAVAHFFGVSPHADVLQAAFRAPNLLQNLLGEATLSAAFIPIYSRMIAEGRDEEAGRFAGAIFGLLVAIVSAVVILGCLFARPMVWLLVPGWVNDAAEVAAGRLPINRFDLTIQGMYIIFPMTGILVLSAWALGILNSHRRFFMPYFAPVLWNVAIIAGLFVGASLVLEHPFSSAALQTMTETMRTRILFASFWGALAGGLLQFLVQLPLVLRLMKGFRPSLSTRIAGVREAGKAFGPVVAGRGIYQLSGYLDMFLASFINAGAVGLLRYSQMLYQLPVSLFGVSVAASELPELSRIGADQIDTFIDRMNRSIRQMLFLTIPTTIVFLAFGYLIVGLLLRTGSFTVNANWLVYLVLCAYTFGLLATTMTRLMQNAFYALNDTKTPARFAFYRVIASTIVAVPLMFLFDRIGLSSVLGLPAQREPLYLGSVGLAIGASFGAWAELWFLRAALIKRLHRFHLPWGSMMRMVGIAVLAMLPAALVWWLLPGGLHVAIKGMIVLAIYGVCYLAASHFMHVPEMEAYSNRFLARFRRKG